MDLLTIGELFKIVRGAKIQLRNCFSGALIRASIFTSYRSLNLTRDAEGVLVAQFHTNGAPFIFTAQDRANKIVILTGAGGEFIPGIDFATFGNVADPGVWSQVHDEGVQIVENIANIRVPLIAAVEGHWRVS